MHTGKCIVSTIKLAFRLNDPSVKTVSDNNQP